MSDRNEKYFVCKREAFDLLLIDFKDSLTPLVGGALNAFASAEVEDAVVIRRQDVYAGPSFDTYANNMLTTIETINHLSGGLSNEVMDAQLAKLQEVADYFHEQAELAAMSHKKLPD